ncbi:hypothetical protein KKB55_23120, partial [Myxococcota bacterium]|nr:hypothetical protein [Myxococcota bacterium]
MARQNIRLPIWSILLMSFGLWACDDDGGTTTIYVDADLSGQCAPACDPNACQACDTSGETPACVNTCGEGTTCQAGACVAEAPAACAPACDACQTCDMSGASPVCVDLCAEGTECV